MRVAVNAINRIYLDAIVADRNTHQKHVWRARIVLLAADGRGTAETMRDVGVSKTAVCRWQERVMTDGVAGLPHDKERRSRVPPLEAEVVARVAYATLANPPGEMTRRTAAAGQSPGHQRQFAATHLAQARLQPHRTCLFEVFNDPQFAARPCGRNPCHAFLTDLEPVFIRITA